MTSFDFNAWHLNVNANEVDLSNSNITSNDLISLVERLKEMPNLVKLSLNNNEITTIDSLGSLVNLKVLNLNQNPITNSDILDSFSNLTELYVNGGHNQITTRSQYITNDSSSIETINKYEDPDSPVEQAYGLCDRCHRKSVPSSFDIAFDVEKKRIEGLVIDKDPRDTKLEMVFDFFMVIFVFVKRPRICGNGTVARWSFVFLQLIMAFTFLILYLRPVQSILCQGALPHYQCPRVQNRLNAANLTVTSNIDAQIIAMGLQDLKKDDTDEFFRSGVGYTYNFADDINLSNHSQFWSTLPESERDLYRFGFIKFRAATVISRLLHILMGISVFTQLLVFFKTFHVDENGNTNNSLYPAVMVREKNGRVQFVRRRRYVMERAMCFALVMIFPFPLLILRHVSNLVILVFGFSAFLIINGFLTGFSIQKDNVNVLSISLTECKTAEDFADWMNKLYKPTIALLHLWSRSFSTAIVCWICAFLSLALSCCHKAAILHIQLEQQKGVIPEKLLYDSALSGITPFYIFTIFSILMILQFLVGLSITSMHYKGLQIVLASLELPKKLLHEFCFEDFLLLQKSRGAFTIYGFPVTVSRSLQLFQFVAVTSLLSMISLAYLSPYY